MVPWHQNLSRAGREAKIPKGFRPSAQRCHDEGGATLGGESEIEINPNGVAAGRDDASHNPVGVEDHLMGR